VSLPVFRLAHPKVFFLFPYNLNGVVFRTTVDNYIFKVGITLEKNWPNRFFDKVTLIKAGATMLIFGQRFPSGCYLPTEEIPQSIASQSFPAAGAEILLV